MVETWYLDTGVFVTPLLKNLPSDVVDACRSVLERVARLECRAVTSALTWDEVTWIAGKPAKGEAFDARRAATAGKLLLCLSNLVVAAVDLDVLRRAQTFLQTTTLKPRDCVHASTAALCGASRLMSVDSDFAPWARRIGIGVHVLGDPQGPAL